MRKRVRDNNNNNDNSETENVLHKMNMISEEL